MNIVCPMVLCSQLSSQFLEEYNTDNPKHVTQHLNIKPHLPDAYESEIRRKGPVTHTVKLTC